MVTIALAALPQAVFADFLVGLNPASLYSISKEATGIYRTPVSSRNIDLTYKETLTYYGLGIMFEAGFSPGHAGVRILPTLYKGSTDVASSDFTASTYDLLGFTNDQATKLETAQPDNVKIRESGIGTGIIFKYNAPTKFKARNQTLKIIQMVVSTMNPWFGLGPMQITFSRNIEAEGQDEFAQYSYTDFYLLIGGGMNLEPHNAWKPFPRNVIISIDLLFSTNLTPDNDKSTNDDNLNIDQGGIMFNFGAGYRL